MPSAIGIDHDEFRCPGLGYRVGDGTTCSSGPEHYYALSPWIDAVGLKRLDKTEAVDHIADEPPALCSPEHIDRAQVPCPGESSSACRAASCLCGMVTIQPGQFCHPRRSEKKCATAAGCTSIATITPSMCFSLKYLLNVVGDFTCVVGWPIIG